MPGGREGCCSPSIAILDANVSAAVELLAILKPAVGWLGVTGQGLALQRLLLSNLSCLTLHLLQLGLGGCRGIRQRGKHGGGRGTVSSLSSGGGATVLGLGLERCRGELGEPPLLVSFPSLIP